MTDRQNKMKEGQHTSRVKIIAWYEPIRKILADFPVSFVLAMLRASPRNYSYTNTL